MIVPRYRSGEFEPQVVKKRQMDITKIEDKIIGLYSCGINTRGISDNNKAISAFVLHFWRGDRERFTLNKRC